MMFCLDGDEITTRDKKRLKKERKQKKAKEKMHAIEFEIRSNSYSLRSKFDLCPKLHYELTR